MSNVLRDFQVKARDEIYAAWHRGARNVMCCLPTAGGKCLGKGTPVLMASGETKLVEHVRVGDLLLGPSGAPRKVLSLARGREMLYRVTPKKGDSYVVNESHILSLKMTLDKKIVNISVRDYLKQNRTFKHCAKGWRPDKMDWADQPVPLDPYFLGLWLGDGTQTKASISKPDPEVIHYVTILAFDHDCDARVEHTPGKCPTTHIIRRKGSAQENPVTAKLRALGVTESKHIPKLYLLNSRRKRLDLLAGLMDSDGHLTKTGFDWISASERLARDVLFLCRSLGFSAYLSKCQKGCQNGFIGTYWRLSINGACDTIPTMIPRKRAPKRKMKKDVCVVGIEIEPLEVGDYYGFELDGDRLFLLGDFQVTHNTVLFSEIIRELKVPACVIAHRNELVVQASLALARAGIKHGIIAPNAVIQQVVALHTTQYGRSFYLGTSSVRVAGVDTLNARTFNDRWFQTVRLVVQDEGHHVLVENKWGRAMTLFPNANGLFVTAHAIRADGKGLGREAEGLVDALVIGPSGRDLINRGFLSEYRLIAPPSDVDVSDVPISAATGDYSSPKLRAAMHRSRRIVGDVVAHYLKFAAGKLGITFAVDIEAAEQFAKAYNEAGVPAAVITGKTPIMVRAVLMEQLRRRRLLQPISVDVLGEGVDIPALEVVSFARPTKSFQLYAQQAGRALRIMVSNEENKAWGSYTDEQRLAKLAASAKPHAIILDHVANYSFHGLPDVRQTYFLGQRERRNRSAPTDAIPLRACLNPDCLQPFERTCIVCPYCGTEVEPQRRSTPQEVEGDLVELDPAVLAKLRGEIDRIDSAPVIPRALGHSAAGRAIVSNHKHRQEAQRSLRAAMALYGGWRSIEGESLRVSQKNFFHRFSIDVLTAQTLNAADAKELEGRIRGVLEQHGIEEHR